MTMMMILTGKGSYSWIKTGSADALQSLSLVLGLIWFRRQRVLRTCRNAVRAGSVRRLTSFAACLLGTMI